MNSGNIYTGTAAQNEDNAVDTVEVKNIDGGTIHLGNADVINITNLLGGTVTSKNIAGSSVEANVTSMSGGTLDLGSGNDVVSITKTMSGGSIYLADGDDVINIKGGYQSGTVNTGTGKDTVTIDSMSGGTLSTEAGDDTVNINYVSSGTINLGDGNDSITINSYTGGTLNGGAGTDTLHITGGGNTLSASNISAFEVIDLGSNAADDANTFIIDRAQMARNKSEAMYIDGDASDEVRITAIIDRVTKLVDGEGVTVGDTTYNLYATYSTDFENAPRYVYVDTDITNVVI